MYPRVPPHVPEAPQSVPESPQGIPECTPGVSEGPQGVTEAPQSVPKGLPGLPKGPPGLPKGPPGVPGGLPCVPVLHMNLNMSKFPIILHINRAGNYYRDPKSLLKETNRDHFELNRDQKQCAHWTFMP